MLARPFKPVASVLLFGWLGYLIAFQIDSGAHNGSRGSEQLMEWIYDITDVIGPVATGIIIAALGPIVAYALWRKPAPEASTN